MGLIILSGQTDVPNDDDVPDDDVVDGPNWKPESLRAWIDLWLAQPIFDSPPLVDLTKDIAITEPIQAALFTAVMIAIETMSDVRCAVLLENVVNLMDQLGQPVRQCRSCGCTDNTPCASVGCSWVDWDLCSACEQPAVVPIDTRGKIPDVIVIKDADDLVNFLESTGRTVRRTK